MCYNNLKIKKMDVLFPPVFGGAFFKGSQPSPVCPSGNEGEYGGAFMGVLTGGTEILEEKPVSAPRFLPSIYHGLSWDRTAPPRLEAGAHKEKINMSSTKIQLHRQ
jgi:hypothetical protein